jgi:hypothetical protein
MPCVVNLCDWELQVYWLEVAGFLETSMEWHGFEVAALFSPIRPAILLLQNFKLSARSSLLSFLSFLLTSLSCCSSLPHLAAVACLSLRSGLTAPSYNCVALSRAEK